MNAPRQWFWAGRAIGSLSVFAVCTGVSEVRVAAAMIIAVIMFAVSAILEAIEERKA